MAANQFQEINIENFSVYKISMGNRFFPPLQEFIELKKILVNQDSPPKGRTKESQGNIFLNRINVGDFFYLTYGNGYDAIKLLGKISNNATLSNYKDYGKEGWLERSFDLIAFAKINNKYEKSDSNSKWWTPNVSSSCIQIPNTEISLANTLIFEPYFGIKFITNSEINDDYNTSINKIIKMQPSLNQILFGPPGTGKTYNTINKALEILGENITKTEGESPAKFRERQKEIFDKKLKDGQIVFTTFHQSMSYEDFIEGIKPTTLDKNDVPSELNNKPKDISYDVQDGIFKKICKLAGSNISIENFDEVYKMLLLKIANEKDEMLELRTSTKKSFWIGVNSVGSLKLFTSENKNYQGVFTKEGIRAFANGIDKFDGWEGYALGIVSYMKAELNLQISTNQKNNNNFVLIIDEINRGNVSAIFGELITLIEEDKRLGKSEVLKVTLPYSKEKFGVPPNLYIIGTMNTADRSVEALDTALRRRFSFEEMPPNYDLIELSNKIFDYPAWEILKTINHRIEKLLDKDHLIGHSYFISKDEISIVESFYKCIIPLLQEYFFGDYGKIGLVLGKGFVKQKEWDKTSDSFADFDYDNSSDFEERNVFEIIDYRNDKLDYSIKGAPMTFQKAIKLLMKNTIE